MSLGFDGAGTGTSAVVSGDGDGDDAGGAGGEEGCGELSGEFAGDGDGDGGEEIGDVDDGLGESAASSGDGLGEGAGGEEEDTALNWTRRKARSSVDESTTCLAIVGEEGGDLECLVAEKMRRSDEKVDWEKRKFELCGEAVLKGSGRDLKNLKGGDLGRRESKSEGPRLTDKGRGGVRS